MSADTIPEWSDELVAQSFRAEIHARFEEHNAAHRARETAELEEVLRKHPEKQGCPGYEVHDSGAWCVYQGSEVRVDRNVVTIVLPRGIDVGIDFVHMFDNTRVAWSRPSIGAVLVDGEAYATIEILLVATWDSSKDAEHRASPDGQRQLLAELSAAEVRALVAAASHAADNCDSYVSEEPLAVLARARDRLRLALEPLP